MTISQRFLIVCTVFPVYVLIGLSSGFLGLLVVGYVSTVFPVLRNVFVFWDSSVPAILSSFILIPTVSAYLVITVIDRIFRRTTCSDRIVLAAIVGGIYRILAYMGGY